MLSPLSNYRQCSISLMDTIADPDIRFDEQGICNYYYEFKQAARHELFAPDICQQKLEQLVADIKHDGKNKPYDCIMGLSGGVDSTYVAWLAAEWGLRPLAVHFDNGWNSELAVKNIENIVSSLNIDLHTLVVDWEEFRDLQLAYLKASVVDIEIPTDQAIYATIYQLALKYKVKYILSGNNLNSEYVMPPSWIYRKGDHVNLLDIHRQFGTKKLKTYPLNDTLLKKRYQLSGIKMATPLNWVNYNKAAAKQLITDKLKWRDYGGKHYESLFTKFYQAYILPQKFKIDKRKPHLSSLIFSGQLTKAEALEELSHPLYEESVLKQEMDFVLKKLGLSREVFESIMALPPRSHFSFRTERPLDETYAILKPVKFIYRKLFSKSGK